MIGAIVLQEVMNEHYYFINTITREQRPLTEEQYNDTSYTINTGE